MQNYTITCLCIQLNKGFIMSEKLTYKELEKRVLELEEIELELKKTEILLNDEINWRRLLVDQS